MPSLLPVQSNVLWKMQSAGSDSSSVVAEIKLGTLHKVTSESWEDSESGLESSRLRATAHGVGMVHSMGGHR